VLYSTARNLCFQHQHQDVQEKRTTILTTMSNSEKLIVIHYLSYEDGTDYLTCHAKIINNGEQKVTLELLSSFTLGFISPFQKEDGAGKYKIHRFKSSWSSEGRHLSESAEQLELESSWCNHAVKCERFGQLGSIPVRHWFPFLGVEDVENGISWGAHMEAPGSWQMEIYRKDDFIHLSGGQADREFGHWMKMLSPGESFQSKKAFISTVAGGVDELCNSLIGQQTPKDEIGMASVFNEWCTNWGNPSTVKLLPLLERVQSIGCRYFVIDAGWYADNGGSWEITQGDWNISKKLFPNGLADFCQTIRNKGLIPGLWFEPEVVGEHAEIRNKHEWLLHLDGKPIKSGSRFFFDFRKAEVRDYLESKIFKLIRECDIGYIKIDYNETIGLGCDGDESPGAGLMKHLEAVQLFYKKLKTEFPELIIENCSSGGQRLEPSFINLTDISSFSDAHETRSIPIIAANIQRLITPSKSLVWAVCHPTDNPISFYYKLAATFLGRMCISGEIDQLSKEYLAVITTAVDLHKRVASVIRLGESRRFGDAGQIYNDPQGWQAVVRNSGSVGGSEVLVIVHSFRKAPNKIVIPLHDAEKLILKDKLIPEDMSFRIDKRFLYINNITDFTGAVFLLSREM